MVGVVNTVIAAGRMGRAVTYEWREEGEGWEGPCGTVYLKDSSTACREERAESRAGVQRTRAGRVPRRGGDTKT